MNHDTSFVLIFPPHGGLSSYRHAWLLCMHNAMRIPTVASRKATMELERSTGLVQCHSGIVFVCSRRSRAVQLNRTGIVISHSARFCLSTDSLDPRLQSPWSLLQTPISTTLTLDRDHEMTRLASRSLARQDKAQPPMSYVEVALPGLVALAFKRPGPPTRENRD